MKKLFPASALILMILFLGGCSLSRSDLVLTGEVEGTILSQHCEVAGKITQMPIELGQQVKAGEVIAVIDDSEQKYALEQLQAVLVKKQAVLAELIKGAELEVIKQAQNHISLAEQGCDKAQLTLARAGEDYDRALKLYQQGALPQKSLGDSKYQLDLSQNALNAARAQLDNARQQMQLIIAGASPEKIAAAKAEVIQTESQISQMQEHLPKYTIKASTDGTIISKNYLLGDLAAPGYNLADIMAQDEKYLVAYLPEDHLAAINYGQELIIKTGDREYKGKISFIDLKAQYTPKDMQTAANKNKDSVKIKVRLAPDTPLKPGERAQLLVRQ